MRNTLRYVSWKERKAVAADLRKIYTAPTAEAAGVALDSFAAKWDARFPSISQFGVPEDLHRDLAHTLGAGDPFFLLPAGGPEGHLHHERDRVDQCVDPECDEQAWSVSNGGFGAEGALPGHHEILARWRRPVKDWSAALNHFAIVFEGRVAR